MNTLPIVLYLLSQGFRLHKSLAIQISYRMYVSTWARTRIYMVSCKSNTIGETCCCHSCCFFCYIYGKTTCICTQKWMLISSHYIFSPFGWRGFGTRPEQLVGLVSGYARLFIFLSLGVYVFFIFYFLFFDNANLEHRCNAIYSKYLLHRTIVLSQRFVSITAPEETAQRSVVMCLVMILSALKIL